MSTQKNELPVLHGPWSYSRVKACSLSMYREKVARDPPTGRPDELFGTDRRALGQLLHLGVETQIGALRKFGRWPDPTKLAEKLLALNQYTHVIDEFEYIVESLKMVPDKLQFKLEDLIEQEYSLAFTGNWKEVPFKDCPPDGWRGKIDLFQSYDGVGFITDYKNRPAIFKNDEIETDEQLSLYAYLVAKKFPKLRDPGFVRVAIYYFQFGVHQILEISWDQVDENVERLMSLARHKESLSLEKIKPEPGFGKCQYCDYLNDCDGGITYLTKSLIKATNPSNARELGKRIFVVDEWVKSARSALNKYTKENGPVLLDNGTGFGHTTTVTKEFDTESVFNTLKDAGLNPWDAVKVDSRGLDKAIKGNEIVADKIKKATTFNDGTKFKTFRPIKEKVKGKDRK